MSDCRNCGSPAKNFVQMRADIERAEQNGLIQDIPKELLVAIGVKESHGRKYFSKEDTQYRQNLNALKSGLHVTEESWLKLIVDAEGPAKGLIPKFRYEPSWQKEAQEIVRNLKMPAVWNLLLPVSYGYFQKSLLYHLKPKDHARWGEQMRLFFHSSNEQIKVCANDMHYLIRGAHGDLKLALSRYNAGPSIKSPTDYGKIVFGFYTHELGISPGKE